jgi:hypothetical protein
LVQQQSGGWTMTGKVPVARVKAIYPWPVPSEGMEAIHDIKTMAGSPDAEAAVALQTASRNLAHGFCVLGFRQFREPMKDISNV